MNVTERYSRQSFLGPKSQALVEATTVAVVGLGGGGSHVVQQFSHVGFTNLMGFDPQCVEEANLNRLVGGETDDPEKETPKTEVASRLVRRIQGKPLLKVYKGSWEDHQDALMLADVVVGCVDGFAARRDLEAFCRRWLIPLVDIGIDVHSSRFGPLLTGQVILSMPGHACMQCLGLLSEANLAREAQNYGDAGPRPQVVWPNGVVASIAVGIVVDLVTDWTNTLRGVVYQAYDGNRMTVSSSKRLLAAPEQCEHYPISARSVGVPEFRQI